ncbi:putative DNA primase/helicase [Oryzisolibacter propanilivorax]|uniref:Putative DNA primase/helicase n=1 Tax=Oryzisolibacter propanilivorax TaxID=1527607 RepID=A0A1G9RHM4_9BURK|nr:AAA family ATPase [Oryzisolibacter propanilivorax]SDM22681.1 putative DNA primase/helicase [Oryzisolibacter propanilivorax]
MSRVAQAFEQAEPVERTALRHIVLASGADLQPTPVCWLWPGWLALGKLHILAGAPGQGKTTIALGMAATVTIGGRWPDGNRCDKGSILVWSGEDDPADTLLPRLLAAGADRTRCHFIEGTRGEDGALLPFDPATDLHLLRQAIERIGDVRLLVVDPVVSAVTGDSHKNTEVRRAMQPLVDLASACQCAVLGITHFAKGGQGSDPAQRVVGSVAFTAVARVVLVAAKVKGEEGEDTRILARSKSNIGPDGGGFEYHLEQCEPLPEIQASRIAWGKSVEGTARELLTDPEDEGDDLGKDAASFLRSLLEVGPMSAKDVFKDADGAGYSRDQIKRASQKIGVDKRKDGMGGGWMWALQSPEGSTKGAKSARFENTLPSLPSALPSAFGQQSDAEDSAEGSQDSYFGNGESSESSGVLESSAQEVL